jgi:Glutathione S-transferase, N-terminal domain
VQVLAGPILVKADLGRSFSDVDGALDPLDTAAARNNGPADRVEPSNALPSPPLNVCRSRQGLARDIRVRWALEETGQPYDIRLLSFSAMKQPADGALHAFGQIPTYEESDLALFE